MRFWDASQQCLGTCLHDLILAPSYSVERTFNCKHCFSQENQSLKICEGTVHLLKWKWLEYDVPQTPNVYQWLTVYPGVIRWQRQAVGTVTTADPVWVDWAVKWRRTLTEVGGNLSHRPDLGQLWLEPHNTTSDIIKQHQADIVKQIRCNHGNQTNTLNCNQDNQTSTCLM